MSYDRTQVPRRLFVARLSARIREVGRGVTGCVRSLAFWLAVATPWMLLVMVASGGVTSNPGGFVGLLAGTVACLVAGRNHAP